MPVKRVFIASLFLLLFFLAASFALVFKYPAAGCVHTYFDRHHNFLASLDTFKQGRQMYQPLDQFSPIFINKTLSKEDRFFYWHLGINPYSILRSLAFGLTHPGSRLSGGSTITQQLAKNIIQGQDANHQQRTLRNKFIESLFAVGLELTHSKDWILEKYLNSIYYGRHSYGAGAASLAYFGRDLKTLNSSQIDFLTSCPQNPKKCERTPENVGRRDNLVGRHFVEWLDAKTDWDGPLEVTTTLDLGLQTRLESLVKNHFENLDDPKWNAAIVVLDLKTMEILAMVGSRHYLDKGMVDGAYNSAVSLRQPGSTLKPFTYLGALLSGYSPDSLTPDLPLTYPLASSSSSGEGGYFPQNFDRQFHGAVPLKEALANSYNASAVYVLNSIGLSFYHQILKNFGFTSLNLPPDHYGLSVTLGSGEVSLLELTQAYARLARNGEKVSVKAILDQKEKSSQVAVQKSDLFLASKSDEIKNVLNNPLYRLKTFGFNEDLDVEGVKVAVKTGTSFQLKDNWTVGFTNDRVVGVWVGHSDASPLLGTTGATGAAPLWRQSLESVIARNHPDQSRRTFAIEETKSHLKPQLAEKQKKLPSYLNGEGWRLVNPKSNFHYRKDESIPDRYQAIKAAVLSESDHIKFDWYLDEKPVARLTGSKDAVWIPLEKGEHQLEVISSSGKSEMVAFSVE